ncbi:MAG: hypothetical protein LDL53_07245 [Candidatus Hydrogenedens sp.]|nr:hypothetical protein [Candidatus Hydrogenedens sp.]
MLTRNVLIGLSFLCFFSLISYSEIYEGEDTPKIYISSIEQLQQIGLNVNYPLNGEYELTQDIDASSTKDWNNGAGFKPIGVSMDKLFDGKFDGKNYVIRNLHINRPETLAIGLFNFTGKNSEIVNVNLQNVSIKGLGGIGGLIGFNFGLVNNCKVTGTIDSNLNSSNNSAGVCVGGLIGTNVGSVSNCSAECSVKGSLICGGLLGANGSTSLGGLGNIENCYSNSVVSCQTSGGGLVGYNKYGFIQNSSAVGKIVDVQQGAGGICGINSSSGTIRCSSASVWVIGSDTSSIIGGLTGINEGSIQNCYSLSSVRGGSQVGGFFGSSLGGIITNSYSAGKVKGIGENIGGFGGYAGETTLPGITNCYWDKEASGQTISMGGEGKTTTEMKNSNTFVNWDFNSIWRITEGQTYPYLYWQNQIITSPVETTEEGEMPLEGSLEGSPEGISEGVVEGEISGNNNNTQALSSSYTRVVEEEISGNKNTCGCNTKDIKEKGVVKFVVDFILVGAILISLLCMGVDSKKDNH